MNYFPKVHALRQKGHQKRRLLLNRTKRLFHFLLLHNCKDCVQDEDKKNGNPVPTLKRSGLHL